MKNKVIITGGIFTPTLSSRLRCTPSEARPSMSLPPASGAGRPAGGGDDRGGPGAHVAAVDPIGEPAPRSIRRVTSASQFGWLH